MKKKKTKTSKKKKKKNKKKKKKKKKKQMEETSFDLLIVSWSTKIMYFVINNINKNDNQFFSKENKQ